MASKPAPRILQILRRIDIPTGRWHFDQDSTGSGQLSDQLAKTDIAAKGRSARIQPRRQNYRRCTGKVDFPGSQASRG
jgi:hypothetical protein